MHARARQLARRHDVSALEHLDDPPDRAARLLALGAQHQVAHRVGHRAARAAILARARHQRRQPTAAVRVIPILNRARRDPHDTPDGRHVVALGRRLEQRRAIAVIETRAHQRAEHTEAKHRELSTPLVIIICHRAIFGQDDRHKRWDRHISSRRPTAARPTPRSHETKPRLESMHERGE
jgi:hypothetical protein